MAMEIIFQVGNLFDTSRTGSIALNSFKWCRIRSLDNWYYRMSDACIGFSCNVCCVRKKLFFLRSCAQQKKKQALSETYKRLVFVHQNL